MESLDYAKFLVAFLCWGVLAFLLLCFIVCAVLDWKESGRARREAAALRELLGVANELGILPEILEQTQREMVLTGNAFWRIERDEQGRPTGLQCVRMPDRTYSDGKGDG